MMHRSSYAFSAAELGDVLLAAQSLQHDADLFFRRIMPAGLTPNVLQNCSAGALSGPDFCFIFAPCGYDEPEILPSSEVPQFVSGVLTGNTAGSLALPLSLSIPQQ